jgi:hypothetical protein
LAPLAIERWCAAVVWIVVGLPVAFAVANDEPSVEVVDGGFCAAVPGFLLWMLRRQRRGSIAAAPPVPARVRIDSTWRTVALGALSAPFVVLVFAAGSAGTGPRLPVLLAVVGAVFAWNALQIQLWEKRTGSRTYRQRIVFARGVPFFYTS